MKLIPFKLAALLLLTLASFSILNAQTPAVDKTEVKTIKVGQVELAYQVRGEGKPLIMVNGYKSTLAMWDPALLKLLEKNYKVIVFDNRGIGLSTDTSENLTTVEQMADDAAGLIKALGYDRAYVLGWSMGARIVQQMAIRHPEVVEKLILCAPNPGGTHQVPTTEEVTKKLNDPTLPKEQSIGLFFTPGADYMHSAEGYLNRLQEAVNGKEIPNDFAVSDQTIERQNQARGGTWNTSNDNFEALSNIKIPVLITDGKQDIIDLPGNVEVIADRIPYAWVAYFETGHAFMFQEHERFADLVKAFLE